MNRRKMAICLVAVLVLGILGTALWVHAQPKKDDPPASDAVKTAPSRITHVTVYQNNALVTREVEVPGGVGTFELVVSPLPAMTINSSLYSEGGDGLVILSTRFRSRALEEDTREEVRKLQAKLKERQESAQKIQSEMDTLKQNLAMLTKLEDFTSATT